MLTFNMALKLVQDELKNLHFEQSPHSLFEPIEYILSLGGKRLRPVLSLLSCDLFGADPSLYVRPILGFEVFHNFTLLHDDLMDKASMRRNQPTVHKKWNNNTAILSGDAMLIAAYQLIAEVPDFCTKEINALFSKTAMEICAGQQYDMEFENRLDVTEADYLEMIRLKTAVLLACALQAGALLAKACPKDQASIYQFGINIGMAFQLQDDLLDVYGDPETFGKNIGGDILCDKKTFLYIKAYKGANTTQKAELDKWLGFSPKDPNQKISAITQIYNEMDLKKETEQLMNTYYQKAMSCLNELTVPAERSNLLRKIAQNLLNRHS